MFCQMNQETLKSSKNNHKGPSTFVPIVAKDLLKAFIYGFVLQVISRKTLCSKHFTRNSRDITYENNRNYNSYKFPLVSFLF